MKRSAAASLLAVGFLSMTGQVALLRELAVASFGVELVFLAGTALWLAAGAAGALARPARTLPARAPPAPPAERGPAEGRSRGGAMAAGFAGLAALLLAEAAFLRGARILLGGVPGAYLPLGRQLATAAIGLMPAGALLGWLFRRGAADLAGAGGSLAAAYAWESLGGALGSVAGTAAFPAGLSNLSLLVACSAASALVALRHPRWRRRGLALGAGLAAILPLAPALDRATTAWNHPRLAHVVDTPYGRVAIVASEGQVVAFENDALSYDSEATDAEALAHAPALEVRERARVLVLEGASAGLVREVLKHRPERVVGVEMNEALHRALRRRLPGAERAALAAPGVELRFEDPRAFLLRSAERFDLVLVGAPEPSSGQTNRFYTAEFFRRCAARLAPGGVLAVRLPSSENFWTPAQLRRNGAVHAALRAVFPQVLVLPGPSDVMLASASPLERDAAVLGERLRRRGVANREVTPAYLRYQLTNDRAAELERLLTGSGAPANSDARPVCYEQTALLWLGRVAGGAQEGRLPGSRAAIGALATIAALVVAAAALRRGRRVVRVGVASWAGMTLEAVVLLRYQAEAGALYRDLGLLLTSFMIGLAAGAAAFEGVRRHAGKVRAGWSAIPIAGLALLGAGLGASIRSGQVAGLVTSAALLLATGAMVAAVFAAAGEPGRDGADAGALYAADLVGGCAGSLLAVGLLVLALGTDGTALAAAGVAAVLLVAGWVAG